MSVKRSFRRFTEFWGPRGGRVPSVEELKSKNQQHQMNTTKTLLAGAAVAGPIIGSMAVRAFAAGDLTPAGAA